MVTVYLKNGGQAVIYEAVRVQYSKVPGTTIPRLACYDGSGDEVASFLVGEISGHHVDPKQVAPLM